MMNGIMKRFRKGREKGGEFLVGEMEPIQFVSIHARYMDQWIYCFHKRRKSFECPGGHVEEGETALQAAKRELYEETGITDCRLIPLWDYNVIWDDGIHSNTGRVYVAVVNSLGELPESEMERIELYDDVPENFSYDREKQKEILERVEKMLKAHTE